MIRGEKASSRKEGTRRLGASGWMPSYAFGSRPPGKKRCVQGSRIHLILQRGAVKKEKARMEEEEEKEENSNVVLVVEPSSNPGAKEKSDWCPILGRRRPIRRC